MHDWYTALMERVMPVLQANWQLSIMAFGALFLLGGIFNWRWTWDPNGHKVFVFPLGPSLSGGADAWCVTWKFEKQTVLPGNRLPEDGIVPFLLEAPPKKQLPIQLCPIPRVYYQK